MESGGARFSDVRALAPALGTRARRPCCIVRDGALVSHPLHLPDEPLSGFVYWVPECYLPRWRGSTRFPEYDNGFPKYGIIARWEKDEEHMPQGCHSRWGRL